MSALHTTRFGRLGLLVAVLAGLALDGYGKPRRTEATVLQLELPPVPMAWPSVPGPALAVEPWHPASGGAICGGVFPAWRICGCGFSRLHVGPARDSRLPDAVAVLGAAYRNCEAITVEMLDPRIPVENYPAGYFGDWVRDGVLVTARNKFTDETAMRRIFVLLAQAAGVPEEDPVYWIDEPGFVSSADDYRRETGFSPELTFEFLGEVPLRVEVNVSQRRLLLLAGDHWDSYELDRDSVAALKQFIAKRGG